MAKGVPFNSPKSGGRYASPTADWTGTIDKKSYSTDNYNILTTSFSGADCVVQFMFPGARPVTVGTAHTVTYSIYREKRQVRTLGRTSPKGTTKGPMTVAGTIIFTVLHNHVINDIRNQIFKQSNTHPIPAVQRLRMDELPPFDIILTFANEYGQSAKMVIYGVTTTDEAMVFSIEDLFTENTMTYMARDIDTLRGPVTPNMNMYTAAGEDWGNNEMLPKYNFKVENLWPNVYGDYVKKAADQVASDLAKYGTAYQAPIPATTPPASAGGSSTAYADVTVYVKYTDGTTPKIGNVVMTHFWAGGKTTTSISPMNSSGIASFKNVTLENGQATISFRVEGGGVIELSNPGKFMITGDKSVTITLQLPPLVLIPNDNWGPIPPGNPGTVPVITVNGIIDAIEQAFAPQPGSVWANLLSNLRQLGMDLEDFIDELLHSPVVKQALKTAGQMLADGGEQMISTAVDAVVKFLKENWVEILIGIGIVAVTILTGGMDIIIPALGAALGAAFRFIVGLFARGALFAA